MTDNSPDKKKSLDANQKWSMIMTVLPLVFMMNMSSLLTSDSGTRILLSGILGGVGGILGYAVNRLTKDKSVSTKIIALLIMIIVFAILFYFLNKNK